MLSMSQMPADALVTLLPETVITTAVTGQESPLTLLAPGLRSLALQAHFQYGSGGTTAKARVQTSLDGGTTWVDVACFAFTTSAARKAAALHARAPLAPTDVTDGALADNTVLNGPLGDRLRVKLTTTGTYGGNTRLTVTGVAKG